MIHPPGYPNRNSSKRDAASGLSYGFSALITHTLFRFLSTFLKTTHLSPVNILPIYFAMMKHLPSDTQFLIVTLVLVLLLGARATSSFIEEDSAFDQLAGVDKEDSRSLADTTPADRSPASIPLVPLKTSLSSLLSMDLSCGKKIEADYKITGQFVQFKGKNCLKGFKPDRIEIVNRSNGSTASVFPYGHNLYQTDLIQLKAGVNEITIRHDAGGVKFEQTIQVRSLEI